MPTDDDLTALLAVVVVLVPTALEVVRGVSVLEAGILFLGFSVPFAFGGALSGFMIRSRTAPTTLALGAAAMVLGMVALAIVGPDGPLGSLILTLALTGLGNGIVYSAATSYALIDIETDDAAEASAALSAARVLGLAVAVAISTSMMTTIHIGDPSDAWGLGVALLVGAGVTGADGGWRTGRASPRRSDGSLAAVLLPTDTDARRVLGMVKAAFAPAGGFDEPQESMLSGIASSLYGLDLADVPVADDDAVAHAPHEERLHAVHLMVVAASMADERGLVLLAITLGLFQNGSIRNVAGKKVKIARSDTLADDGAVDRWVEAFRRGTLCTTDVMGSVHLFEHRNDPLDKARARFGVVPPRAGL